MDVKLSHAKTDLCFNYFTVRDNVGNRYLYE